MMNTNKVWFREGQVVTAKVAYVKAATVYFDMRGVGSAVLPVKALTDEQKGSSEDLAGRKLRVQVRAWYPKTRQLVFSGLAVEDRPSVEAKPRKADFVALPEGTTFLVDGANLLGAFEPQEATAVLRSVCDGLKAQGHEAKVFLEHRAWKFTAHNQADESAKTAFERLCEELDVALVTHETDLAILQTLAAVPTAVGLTNDRYADYAKAFPSLVGSSRLRGFSVTRIGGKPLVLVDGLAQAIAVEANEPQDVAESTAHVEEPNEKACEVKVVQERVYTAPVTGGLCGHGDVLFKKGNWLGAARCLAKAAAHHQATAYAGLAEISDASGDAKRARKLDRLGEAVARRLRDQNRRNRRIRAERRRGGDFCYAKCA